MSHYAQPVESMLSPTQITLIVDEMATRVRREDSLPAEAAQRLATARLRGGHPTWIAAAGQTWAASPDADPETVICQRLRIIKRCTGGRILIRPLDGEAAGDDLLMTVAALANYQLHAWEVSP